MVIVRGGSIEFVKHVERDKRSVDSFNSCGKGWDEKAKKRDGKKRTKTWVNERVRKKLEVLIHRDTISGIQIHYRKRREEKKRKRTRIKKNKHEQGRERRGGDERDQLW